MREHKMLKEARIIVTVGNVEIFAMATGPI